MKKLLYLFLVLTMVLALAACGNSGDKDAAGNTQDESDLAYVKGKGKMIMVIPIMLL